jgi:hypothetical protein
VVIENDWLVEPAGIVTVAGTVVVVLLLDSDTTAPLVGATAVRLTVPVTAEPPTTELADNTTLDSAAVAIAVAAVVESAHPETATHIRNNAAAARTAANGKRFEPTTTLSWKDWNVVRQDRDAGVARS